MAPCITCECVTSGRVVCPRPLTKRQQAKCRTNAGAFEYYTQNRKIITLPSPRKQRQIGLGDFIAATLNLIGIGGYWKKTFPGCGCGQRQEKLNKLSGV